MTPDTERIVNMSFGSLTVNQTSQDLSVNMGTESKDQMDPEQRDNKVTGFQCINFIQEFYHFFTGETLTQQDMSNYCEKYVEGEQEEPQFVESTQEPPPTGLTQWMPRIGFGSQIQPTMIRKETGDDRRTRLKRVRLNLDIILEDQDNVSQEINDSKRARTEMQVENEIQPVLKNEIQPVLKNEIQPVLGNCLDGHQEREDYGSGIMMSQEDSGDDDASFVTLGTQESQLQSTATPLTQDYLSSYTQSSQGSFFSSFTLTDTSQDMFEMLI